jgi:hypothetical protein
MAGNRDQFPAQLGELSDGWKNASHKQVFAGLSNYLSLGMISRIMARLVEFPPPGRARR